MVSEKRLIDVNDAIRKLEDEVSMCEPVSKDDGHIDAYKKRVIPKLLRNVIDWLQNQPTVDAVEVVHGRWKHARYTEAPLYICSECDKPEYKQHRYCPNCGAKMDGDPK